MKQLLGKLTVALTGALFAVTAHAAQTPDAIVKAATNDVRADITANVATYQKDKNAFYAMVDQKIVPHIDTRYVARVILGSHLKSASEAQIVEFEAAFKDMLIRTYADTLLENYNSIEIEVKPARIDGKRANVDTTIVRKDGKPPIPIVFSMRQVGDDWKVWDIKAENISLVLNFRTQLDSEIKRNGIPKVIERLKSGQLVIDEDAVTDQKQ